MSGHNKWSKVKHVKAKNDAQKSRMFTKAVKLLTIEAKKANGDMNAPGLRVAMEKAREVNMPNDNIDRAIKKAMGEGSSNLEHVTYETYGPGGVAIIIEALTDNRNKAAQEIKHILSSNGYELATPGSAAWAFSKTHEGWIPQTSLPINESDGEKLQALIDVLEDNDEVQEVYTNAE